MQRVPEPILGLEEKEEAKKANVPTDLTFGLLGVITEGTCNPGGF